MSASPAQWATLIRPLGFCQDTLLSSLKMVYRAFHVHTRSSWIRLIGSPPLGPARMPVPRQQSSREETAAASLLTSKRPTPWCVPVLLLTSSRRQGSACRAGGAPGTGRRAGGAIESFNSGEQIFEDSKITEFLDFESLKNESFESFQGFG